MSQPQRQAHYDEHFSDEPQRARSRNSVEHNSLTTWFTPYVPNKGDPSTQNVFWYPARSDPPPRNFSPGLIPTVKRALISSHERGKTQRAWLCHEDAVHIRSEAFDRSWGCGYRNFMMTCASLMSQAMQPTYFPLLDRPTPPGVRNLQSSIEEAWKHGYDPEGAEQLKHRLVGTGKYIGTGDLYAAFTYRGIPAQLVDFDVKNGVQPLLDWVLQHFSAGYSSPRTLNEALQSTNSVAITGKMPLILQHNGHSRTIVGCERCVDGTINLLVFDPAKSIPIEIRNAGLVHHASSRARDNTQQHQEYHVSSPKVLHEVQHPVQAIKAHKRKADETSRTDTSKRPRASIDEGNGKPKGHSDCNSGGQERSKPFEPDPFKVLNIVRLGANKLKWKREYQILYFPLTAPLSEVERWSRRQPTAVLVR